MIDPSNVTPDPSRQFYENYTSQSCQGLALPFLVNWLAGDVTNLVGCVLTDQKEFQVSCRATSGARPSREERASRASRGGLREVGGLIIRFFFLLLFASSVLFFFCAFTCGLFTLLWSSSADILGLGRYVCVSSDLDMDLGCGRGYY